LAVHRGQVEKGPIGVAEYKLVEALPKNLEANLPSVEQIERELGDVKEGT
jgi:hypothetical protein